MEPKGNELHDDNSKKPDCGQSDPKLRDTSYSGLQALKIESMANLYCAWGSKSLIVKCEIDIRQNIEPQLTIA